MSHAALSPSGAHRWMRCPGSVRLEGALPDQSSEYADEGTAAHDLAAQCLEHNVDPMSCIGETIVAGGRTFQVDADFAAAVQAYVDECRREAAAGGEVYIEQRVSCERYVGPGVWGTADHVIVRDGLMIVRDLKFGRGVRVSAAENPQLMLYALGALAELDPLDEVTTVRMVIHQPRLDHLDEWECPVTTLLEFAADVETAARRVEDDDPALVPGEAQCRFCRAKANCPALAKHVGSQVLDDFQNLDSFEAPAAVPVDEQVSDKHLAAMMRAVALVEDWCTAVRAETERRLLSGLPVPGFKLVEGRRGARKWADEAAAEGALKGMRLRQEQMYDLKLISPTTAEKLAKAEVLKPRQWSRLQTLITQPDGKPSVAPESDKRPAIEPRVANPHDFDVVA